MHHDLSLENARKLRSGHPFHNTPHAQPIGSRVQLKLENASAQPLIILEDMRRDFTWEVVMSPGDDKHIWTADILLPSEPTIVRYHFEVKGKKVLNRRLVESRDTTIGNRPVYGEWEDVRYKIAIYDPQQMPADWTQGMVVYQIFPDRFARVQSTEAAREKMKGVYGHEPHLLPWDALPENPPLGRDFFGGDLQGIISKLDYLADMGVECIYLNPIFEASSNHRYEAIDFLKIDHMLGSEADFDELIKAAHQRGMRIVLDAVFNHCSSDSIYFDITGKFGNGATQTRESPYFRWFEFERWPDKYKGWIGLGFMPEFVECPEMEEYFLGPDGVTTYWINKGIDGWRADVPFDNSDGFWQKFRKRVDAIKPEAWTIAEEWRDASNYLLGDMFNATMNYRLTWTVRGFFAMDYLSTSEFDDRLQALLRDTPPPAVHSQMNLLDSHDTDRLLTACGRNRARYLQAFAFLFAYPGAPTIFYGSETGIEGSFSEDSRRPMPWDSLDEELLTFFKHIIQVRKNDVTLRRGQVETILIDDENRVFGLRRYDAARSIVALFNASDTPVQVEVELPENEADGTWTDLLDIHVDVPAQAGKLSLTLAARGAAWYAKK